MMGITRVSAACIVVALATSTPLGAQEPFAEARQMYASAEYEDALTLLDGLTAGDHSLEQGQELALYRALCLVALERTADAAHAIERMIAQDPLYRPAEDVSPRMRAAFRDTRRRVLPGIVQQHYSLARSAFERQDFSAAASGFERVVDALDDPDMADAVALPPLADLRTLASGFHDLSVRAIPPPVASASVEAAVAPAVVPLPNLPPRIYGSEEADVVSPLAIRQELPKFQGPVQPGGMSGLIEIVIDETGSAESARVVESVTAVYDAVVLRAVRAWVYQPATVKGTPVKFRKRIRIAVAEP
jgi:TonB family protein